jgi:hypothetical protein
LDTFATQAAQTDADNRCVEPRVHAKRHDPKQEEQPAAHKTDPATIAVGGKSRAASSTTDPGNRHGKRCSQDPDRSAGKHRDSSNNTSTVVLFGSGSNHSGDSGRHHR